MRQSTKNRLTLGVVLVMALASMVILPVMAELPPGGSFIDDDGNGHEPNIEAIAAAGITTGCNPPIGDQYCPGNPVSRAEMAAFLLRATGGADNLPAYRGTFPDVPAGQWYTGYAEKLAELGISTGYTDGTFRPAGPVTRAEMAIFITRTIGEEGNLTTSRGLFSDVPASAPYAAATERLYDLGITLGCATGPLRYCPADVVSRDQMASFLARAFGLAPVPPPPRPGPAQVRLDRQLVAGGLTQPLFLDARRGTTACSSSSNREGFGSLRVEICWLHLSWTSATWSGPEASGVCSVWRSIRIRNQRALLCQLHGHRRHLPGSRISGEQQSRQGRKSDRTSPRSRFPNRPPITMVECWPSVPTAISTSGWEMVAAGATPPATDSDRRPCSARCCESTSTGAAPTPFRRAIRLWPAAVLREVWAFGLATRGGSHSTGNACTSPTSGRGSGKRLTFSPRPLEEPISGGRSWKATIATSPHPAAIEPA